MNSPAVVTEALRAQLVVDARGLRSTPGADGQPREREYGPAVARMWPTSEGPGGPGGPSVTADSGEGEEGEFEERAWR